MPMSEYIDFCCEIYIRKPCGFKIYLGCINFRELDFGLLFFPIIIAMEDINQRLQTLPSKRQEQFQKVLNRETRRFSPKTETAKEEIIELTKSKILHYLAKEEKEKLE